MATRLLLLLISEVVSEYVEFEFDPWMSFGWEISDPFIDLHFKCHPGWCSFGNGVGMSNADMIVAQFPWGGEGSYRDTWGTGLHTPPLDTSKGGSDDLTLVSSSFDTSSEKFHIILRRRLATGDSYDKDFLLDQEMDFSYAYDGGSGFQKHHQIRKGKITMSNTQEGSSFELLTNIPLHKVGMDITWYFGMVIAIIMARYFKWWMFWYWVHVFIAFFAYIIIFASSVGVIVDEKNVYSLLDENTLWHSRIGWVYATLITIQMIIGLLTRWYQGYFQEMGRTALVRRLHKILGWGMLGLAQYQCALGHYIDDGDMNVAPSIIVVLIFVVFEIRHQLTYYWPKLNFRLFKMKSMSFSEMWNENATGKELVSHEDKILDVRQFKYSHPGMAFVIKEAIGEDMGKYIYGCSSYGGSFLPYYHSRPAIDMIEHLSIAKVPCPENFFLGKGHYAENVGFKLYSKESIAKDTWVFTLMSREFSLNPDCQEASWIGKHFRVTCGDVGIQRYYSCYLVDLQKFGTELQVSSGMDKRPEGSVQLIIKIYHSGLLTPHLHDAKVDEKVYVSGPYGPGLGLSVLEGHFLAVVGGTGLVTVFDLLYFMWDHRDDFDFTFDLYACFSGEQFVFARNVIDALADHMNGRFKIVWICNRELSTNPNDFVDDMKAKSIEKVWICGPSGFNRYIYNLLQTEPAVDKDKIMIM